MTRPVKNSPSSSRFAPSFPAVAMTGVSKSFANSSADRSSLNPLKTANPLHQALHCPPKLVLITSTMARTALSIPHARDDFDVSVRIHTNETVPDGSSVLLILDPHAGKAVPAVLRRKSMRPHAAISSSQYSWCSPPRTSRALIPQSAGNSYRWIFTRGRGLLPESGSPGPKLA
jgi:hypothetical protein